MDRVISSPSTSIFSDNMSTGEYLSAKEREESLTQMMETALETAWSIA